MPSVLERLLARLDGLADGQVDDETKQIFAETRDELRKLNAAALDELEQREAEKEHGELARRFPALKNRPPRRTCSA
jgi:hypothetical protein